MHNAEKSYEEWQKSEEAVSARAELIQIVEIMNAERRTAFVAGFECAMAEVVKYIETLPDKTKSL